VSGHVGDLTPQLPVPMLRVAAYAVVEVDGRVLLTQMSQDTPVPGLWALPGGGLDHGEAPAEAVVREVQEETAHVLRDVRLADVGSHRFTAHSPGGRLEDFHSIQVVYLAGVEQVREPQVLDVGGSTAQARWVEVSELVTLELTAGTRRWLAQLLDRPELEQVAAPAQLVPPA
jgi:ADP-ribose pyrophosphatase YjhB (NUDIX family)